MESHLEQKITLLHIWEIHNQCMLRGFKMIQIILDTSKYEQEI